MASSRFVPSVTCSSLPPAMTWPPTRVNQARAMTAAARLPQRRSKRASNRSPVVRPLTRSPQRLTRGHEGFAFAAGFLGPYHAVAYPQQDQEIKADRGVIERVRRGHGQLSRRAAQNATCAWPFRCSTSRPSSGVATSRQCNLDLSFTQQLSRRFDVARVVAVELEVMMTFRGMAFRSRGCAGHRWLRGEVICYYFPI